MHRMGVAERRAREKEVLRHSILQAAGEIILEEGHASLSIRKIADRIEYAPSTIYLYFQDKLAILAAICVEHFEELADKLDDLFETQMDPVRGLRQGLRCYIEFGLANPNQYQITFLSHPPKDCEPDSPAKQAIHKAGLDCYGRLMRAIQKCMDAGKIPPGDLNQLSQNAWLSVNGITAGLIFMGRDPEFPWVEHNTLIESHISMILKGLGVT
jgi:AcrR family transcriptional regulator